MGILNTFNEWRATRYEKHVSRMKSDNKCPECYGRGFPIYPGTEYAYYTNIVECPGCGGTGVYTDWETEL
ncbi:DnaJ-class molecular chaperone [Cytobacillus eiseniae]|uniref:DnaJ-class molecular chaperone n=1 Tax=Cytobacillus eiseniae TaxID=762947 RepID=A0ABS4RAA7_9BACI|nr:methionine aminopeptidase [Cytobacillus eiseniae]MBP2239614.1 DnaJ-class molecular chaperone [Cytobacillus eiseniae]